MSVSEFYRCEQQKLLLEFDEIALFTSHPTLLGTYREHILRDYIRRFTPAAVDIKTGFVCDYIGAAQDQMFSQQTRQIDCLVIDNQRYTPFLQAKDYVIVPPEAMIAAIEVKSTLSLYKSRPSGSTQEPKNAYPLVDHDGAFRWAGTLVDALENVISINRACVRIKKHSFSGIFAYTCEFDLKKLYNALDDGLIEQLQVKHLVELPEVICVPGNALVALLPTDMFDASDHFNPNMSYFNLYGAVAGDEAQPLQLFTTWYHNSVKYRLSGQFPHGQGLFTGGSGLAKTFSHHFELNSDGLCNEETVDWHVRDGTSNPSTAPPPAA